LYKRTENQLILPDDFFLPFGGKLNKDNRWVKLAQMIPWWKVEEKYAQSFKKSMKGQKALSVRVALGALIIQQRLKTSDRETVQHIAENPYLQYFLGFPEFQEGQPFDPSLMTHFRKRLGPEIIQEVNEWIVKEAQHQEAKDSSNDDEEDQPPAGSGTTGKDHDHATPPDSETHKGKLMLDATCAPADIAYPTDLILLNEAREKLEHLIDVLFEPLRGTRKKPRTYRQKAHRAFLAVAKQRRPKAKTIRKAIGQQLRYVKRDLHMIEKLKEHSPLTLLNKQEYKQLLVISELYRQQREMYKHRTHRIEDRIVSIHQPHVRPIVRGKARARVEFGAKVAISLVDGYALVEKMSWNNDNEALTLQEAVERYRERYGHYPEAVLADQIYRNRENRKYCKEKGIRLSGLPLGRPAKKAQSEQKHIAHKDSAERNAIEGKFGEGKRRYGLGLIQARLQKTSETVIALQFLVMNLERRLRLLFWHFIKRYHFLYSWG